MEGNKAAPTVAASETSAQPLKSQQKKAVCRFYSTKNGKSLSQSAVRLCV